MMTNPTPERIAMQDDSSPTAAALRALDQSIYEDLEYELNLHADQDSGYGSLYGSEPMSVAGDANEVVVCECIDEKSGRALAQLRNWLPQLAAMAAECERLEAFEEAVRDEVERAGLPVDAEHSLSDRIHELIRYWIDSRTACREMTEAERAAQEPAQ